MPLTLINFFSISGPCAETFHPDDIWCDDKKPSCRVSLRDVAEKTEDEKNVNPRFFCIAETNIAAKQTFLLGEVEPFPGILSRSFFFNFVGIKDFFSARQLFKNERLGAQL